MNKDYYQILGLTQDASQKEIREAYRLFASKFHPDIHDGDKFFEERFKEIQEAYEILGDPRKRKEYDDSYFNKSQGNYKHSNHKTNNEKAGGQSNASNTKTKKSERSKKDQRRTKNMLIGVGTGFVFYLLMDIGGKDGWHVPVAILFLFLTIRQFFVVFRDYLPD